MLADAACTFTKVIDLSDRSALTAIVEIERS